MTSRLMRVGDKGFNFDAITGWRYQTHPEFSNDYVIYLYLSGVSEPMFFEGEAAVQVQKLLNAASFPISITPTTP